jgi:phage shock protein PspC (stress-responsive transcriptional regulator)
MENSKYFIYWIGLSALLIAGSAAAFSVYGLAKLFSGAFISVVIMAGALELGKLVTASFLYRYWNMINWFQKLYMTIATIVLVFITSAGIFGYLSNAYQGATLEFEKQSTELLTIEERIEQLDEDKVFLKEELEQAISELPDNYITAKRNLREEYNPQITQINQELLEYKTRRADLEIELVSTGVDVGPAIYLARTFGTDIDTVVKFFIFILIFVFDPLAVMLVIAYNQALLQNKPKEKTQDEHWKDIYSQPTFTDEEDFSVEEEIMLEEDNERMDIIGQNGNDGLHYDLEEDEKPKKIIGKGAITPPGN